MNKLRVQLSYKRGESICKQGAFASSIICIHSGLVKVHKEKANASFTLLLKKQGEVIGLQALFNEGIYHSSAEALTDTNTCSIDLPVFQQLLLENPKFSVEVIKSINEELMEVFDRLFSLSTKHVHGRLAEFLLYLKNNVYKSNPFYLTLSKTDMAEILGTSKESMSRLFKELKKDKIIEEFEHSIKIISEAKLNRISITG
ncbi:MAG: Crp/Fnr family transcriptional regulator [Cyclobacteriaceae bacterium]|nr:Crp/Fnr family transcriptional regulator [Cyclobacteriaceae bacterium]